MLLNTNTRAGKITLYTAATGALAALVGLVAFFEVNVPQANADDVTTSVTVLNTPPVWTVNAQEQTESSTTTPTNSGSTVTWVATGTDSSSDPYYLLICKTSGAPTANSGAAPTCNGGVANQWAVSTSTVSGTQASVSTTTLETFPFNNESNDWYAWVCDANVTLPKCNASYTQGVSANGQASPFVVNHPPVFSAIINDGPVDPGADIAWTATASDTDSLGSNDTVRLFVCKADDFTGTDCGAGGTWATSTLSASNPIASTTIVIPTQDDTYEAYVFVIDNHNHQATSTVQGTNSSYDVSNVAPDVTAASISLNDTDDVGNLTLVNASATTGPFTVKFTAVDNNSCQNVASGAEVTSAIANIYRSGVGQASCRAANHYNPNSCYANHSPNFSSHISCTQDVGSCSGPSDSDVTWTCTFDLWFNADPTDANTPWTAENWLASIEVIDDNTASSTLTESTSGNEVTSFLAFDVTESAIGYGGLEPGQTNDPLASTTDLIATGNVGLDEDLYGDTMCTTWTGPDSCDTDGVSATNDIPVNNQKFATSSVAYASANAFTLAGSSTPTELLINVPKTTSTSSPETKDTYWGISIPASITVSGNYTGQNTITAKVSDASAW